MERVTTIPGLNGSFGGNCPVQGDGELDGKYWYFRARGAYWSFEVSADEDSVTEWEHGEEYGTKFDASWMPDEDVLKCIEKAVGLYRASLEGK
jgi:hypothetical protein